MEKEGAQVLGRAAEESQGCRKGEAPGMVGTMRAMCQSVMPKWHASIGSVSASPLCPCRLAC